MINNNLYNSSFTFNILMDEAFFMTNVIGAGDIINPPSELSFFVYEEFPPSDTHPTPSPTPPTEAYLDHGDYGRADFGVFPPFYGIFSPHHLHGLTLLDHVGGGYCETLLPFSFPSSIPSEVLGLCIQKCNMLHCQELYPVLTNFNHLIFKDFPMYTKV